MVNTYGLTYFFDGSMGLMVDTGGEWWVTYWSIHDDRCDALNGAENFAY